MLLTIFTERLATQQFIQLRLQRIRLRPQHHTFRFQFLQSLRLSRLLLLRELDVAFDLLPLTALLHRLITFLCKQRGTLLQRADFTLSLLR